MQRWVLGDCRGWMLFSFDGPVYFLTDEEVEAVMDTAGHLV